MPETPKRNAPPDQTQREQALDASRSVLVRAPAGSGKTDLLTRRFLSLLGEVEDPGQIVAITFTKAAAAEMRHRILAELEKAACSGEVTTGDDPFSMPALAHQALVRSQALGWNLPELSAQLRISTIDSFCRELALQQPIFSGLGGGLDVSEQPADLYRQAARRTLEKIDGSEPSLREAIEALLLWRDNSWQDVEDQLVAMLSRRDQWMQGFVLDRDPDWDALREQLERPFANAVMDHLLRLDQLFDRVPGAREEAHALARFACEQSGRRLYCELAEMAEFPQAPYESVETLEEAWQAYSSLASLLLTGEGKLRKQVTVTNGFPKENKVEKSRILGLIASLAPIPEVEESLGTVGDLPPARYSDEDWAIVRACFTLLRHAAAELRVIFAEAASADFIEVAQIAQKTLKGEDGYPSETAQAFADNIHHLLVDEFQDTSRRQHQLLAELVAAWSGREGRTCFVVGDPMQSIYFFRDADAELFPRVEQCGLEINGDLPLHFDSVQLTANFRTAPPLVEELNARFAQVFAADDGSGVRFAPATAAREQAEASGPQLVSASQPRRLLHVEFVPESQRSKGDREGKQRIAEEREAAHRKQTEEIVDLIRSHLPQIEEAQAAGRKYRVAVLGRTRRSLEPIAAALREAGIHFRAVKLEELENRPEILDALALARAILNPQDRVAWLGVLRAPWCGLTLADLHTLAGADDEKLQTRPVAQLIAERKQLASAEGRKALERLQRAIEFAGRLRAAQPAATLGTWIEEIWLSLGGDKCVDAEARANLDLLWRTLDSLPRGETELLGPALTAVLRDLKAQPDPEANGDSGVQLMTIHGAKGLEFEVVIIPDLQCGAERGNRSMLSWLERGLPPEVETLDPEQVTEFLVAPFAPKGSDRGMAKKWVDAARRERERQEARRLLYVATTRAREELHLFARPSYKLSEGAAGELAMPRESLLATAWPAWEAEIRQQFEEWKIRVAAGTVPATIEEMAASAEVLQIVGTPSSNGTRLRRLPAEVETPETRQSVPGFDDMLTGTGRLYVRHEGGLHSRALGIAVHSLLEELAKNAASLNWEEAQASLDRQQSRLLAMARAMGIEPAQARHIAAQAVEIATKAAGDPLARWILMPRADAASEVRWTGIINGEVRTVQADRVFRAGLEPQAECISADEETWWIVDYKTAHEEGVDAAAVLQELRRSFAPQIETYAKVLRNLRGSGIRICGGLYYPRMPYFDWWGL